MLGAAPAQASKIYVVDIAVDSEVLPTLDSILGWTLFFCRER